MRHPTKMRGEDAIEMRWLLSVCAFDGSDALDQRHQSVLMRARSQTAFLLKGRKEMGSVRDEMAEAAIDGKDEEKCPRSQE